MNKNIAYKIEVIESEKDWGSKIDDYMVCLSIEQVLEFKREFNSYNDKPTTPDWYMYANGEPIPIELTDVQIEFFNSKNTNRAWLSTLSKIK